MPAAGSGGVPCRLLPGIEVENMADYVRRISQVEYEERPDGGGTLNLYLPMDRDSFPLLIFFSDCIFSGSVKEDLDGLGRELAGKGVAAAIADVRSLDRVTPHTALEDAASAVIYLLRSLNTLGEVTGVFVGGHGSGAWAAMMLAFDKNRLMCRGADPDHLAGFVFAGGVCSTPAPILAEQGMDPARFTADQYAPMSHLPHSGPPILIVAGTEEPGGAAQESWLLEELLRRAGYENKVICRLLSGMVAADYLKRTAGGDSVFASLVVPFIEEELGASGN